MESAHVDDKNITFAYDGNGIRTEKTVNGVKTNYYLSGSNIMTQISGNTRLDFLYDDLGQAIGFLYNQNPYYYIRNLQSDVVGILDKDGNEVVSYEYDAWGALIEIAGSDADTIGQLNPLRYRGYFYDTETGLYYLNSRYYDPVVGRFINADAYVSTGSDLLKQNMFAYCINNPVNNADPSGYFLGEGATLAGIAVISLIIAVVLLAVGAVGSVIVGQPDVINAWAQMFEMMYNAVADTIETAKTKVKNLGKFSDDSPRKHHIVAQRDKRAAKSREVLRRYDINPVKAPENIVVISQKLHKDMHTNNYHRYVVNRMSLCKSYEDVELALAGLRAEILFAEQTGIRMWELA